MCPSLSKYCGYVPELQVQVHKAIYKTTRNGVSKDQEAWPFSSDNHPM